MLPITLLIGPIDCALTAGQTDIERRMSFCKCCRKQFTSIDQLREHCRGKPHLEAEARRAGY